MNHYYVGHRFGTKKCITLKNVEDIQIKLALLFSFKVWLLVEMLGWQLQPQNPWLNQLYQF